MRFVVTFPVALVGLSALTAGGIALAFYSGHRQYAWAVVPIVAVLAAWFLIVYARRPGPEPRRRAEMPTPVPEEAADPFEDPVELADRLDAASPPEAGATEEDGSAPVPPGTAPPVAPGPTPSPEDPAGPAGAEGPIGPPSGSADEN